MAFEKYKAEPSTFVEIGSFFGSSATYMAKKIRGAQANISFYCIDIWKTSYEGTSANKNFSVRDLIHKEELIKTYQAAVQKNGNLNPDLSFKDFTEKAGVKEFVKPLKLSSVKGSQKFKNETVDFLYIDGDHSYKEVKNDILNWLPKMKKGGLIGGDDYNWPGVEQAVMEIFDARSVQVTGPTWYVEL